MIVVTGASGHIGNVLVRRLLEDCPAEQRFRLFLETTDPAPALQDILTQWAQGDSARVEVFRGDITDSNAVLSAFEGATEVFHLAAVICIHADAKLAELATRVNVQGARNVMEACLARGVQHLVYVSSVHALSEPPQGGTVSEECGFDPARVYGTYSISKATAACLVLEAMKERGLKATVVCPTGVMGPHDYRESEFGQLFRAMARGGVPVAVDGGYDFVDVRDVVDTMMRIRGGAHAGQVFLLTGYTITIKELMERAKQVAGVRLPWVYLPIGIAKFFAAFEPIYGQMSLAFFNRRPRLTRYSMYTLGLAHRFDGSRAKSVLGHNPRPLDESIIASLEWQANR